MKYMTPKEAAKKWGISQRRVHTLCQNGRIMGAERHNWIWLIPETSEKPSDARIKSGHYLKSKRDISIPSIGNMIIPRFRLTEKLCPPGSRLTYIHAGAGYGKTTLMMQYAQSHDDAVWLSLDDRDNDPLFFLRRLEASIREKLGAFSFDAADYMPFAANKAFSAIVVSALLKAVGQSRLSILLDDVHAIHNNKVIELLTAIAMVCPPNISLMMASRHEPWSGLFRLKMAGGIAEFTKEDLCFIPEEAKELWGFFDEDAYMATEGWSLAVQSYHLAAKGGKTLSFLRQQAEHDLYGYLLTEIMMQLPLKTQSFLKATCCLPVLEIGNCDDLLRIDSSQEILEDLVRCNIFTQRITGETYRYHALFRAFLQKNDNGQGSETLRRAMEYSYGRKDYEQAAEYALLLQDDKAIQDLIGNILCEPFVWDRNRNLKKYLDFLDAQSVSLSPLSMLAKGMLLSDQGDFFQAEKYLNAVIPQLSSDKKTLYLHAMTHMARVLRNRVSFSESTRCLDTLLPLLKGAPWQEWYSVMIEKIHNLTLTSHLFEAMQLTESMMEQCIAAGAVNIKAWFERYLTVIYFYMGDYKSCIKFFERSQSIPRKEQDWLMRHNIGAYAAKAYQMTGQEEKVVPLLETELTCLKQIGLYEGFSFHYLLRAEIFHTGAFLKRYQGLAFDFSASDQYMNMAAEYAILNRSTHDHFLFVKVWRLCSRLLDHPEKAGQSIQETLPLLKNTTPFFQIVAYGRMANAIDVLGLSSEQSKDLFNRCIRMGEEIGCYAYAVSAYGRLAAIYLREGDLDTAREYTRRFLELSRQYGHLCYMRFRPLYGSVLKFAEESDIFPDFTREMLSYGGYTTERVYIHTLGNFYIASVQEREVPLKIRTKKARELLAYLLEHPKGVTREQIHTDLWEESEADVVSMFHTRRGEIRRAFESLKAKNPVMHENGLYFLSKEEIVCDRDLYRQAANEFRKRPTPKNAQNVVERYTGRYLDDLEALWAESARRMHEDCFLEAAEVLLESYRSSGERTKATELLRRCTGLSYHAHRYDMA